MTAALGTLPFLATLWLLVVLGASVLEESGAKIAAALKGAPQSRGSAIHLSVRTRPRLQQAKRETRQWRAAA
jgi:hypothetical protein